MSSTSTFSETSPKPRRRSWKFWLGLSLGILLALPFVFYLGLYLYVQCGFLNPKFSRLLSRAFDSQADVGSVRTQWLKDLSVENISIKAADKTEPIHIDGVKFDFDTGPLLRDNRLRLVTIDKPRLDFRRDAGGKWNIGLKSEKTESSYRIEQTAIRGGDINLEWGSPARRLKLLSLNGTITDAGPQAPSGFALDGAFESLDKIYLNGTSGPGAAWTARVYGGADLEKDLRSAFSSEQKSPRGHLSFELSGRRETLDDPEKGGPVTFGGDLGLRSLEWPIDAHYSIVAENRKLDISGIAAAEASDAIAALKEIQLRIEGLGALKGSGRVLPAGPTLVLEKANGHIDWQALNEIFAPRLVPGNISVKGVLNATDLTTTIPFGSGGPPASVSAKFSVDGARVSFSTLGELPLFSATGSLNWPSLSSAKVSIGEMARLNCDVANMFPTAENFWLTLAEGIIVHEINVDVNRFYESEVGRRALTANFDLKQPVIAVADLPYIFKGQLHGKEMKMKITPNSAKPDHLEIGGLRLDGASVAKWPLPFKLPAKSFAGAFDLNATMRGAEMETLTLSGNLAESGAAAPQSTHIEFSHTYFPLADPAQRVGPVKIKELVFSLADLEQIFELKKLTGLSGIGAVQISDGTLNLTRPAADATISLEKCDLQFELSSSVQSAIVSALKASDHGVIATALENYPIEFVKLPGLTAKFQAKLEGNRISLKGSTEALPIRVKIPSGVPLVNLFGESDYSVYTLPALNLDVAMELDDKGIARMYAINVAWGKQSHLRLALKPPEIADKSQNYWIASGSFDAAIAGGEVSFNVPIDLIHRRVGDCKLSAKELDLSKFAAMAASHGVLELSGKLKDAELRVKGFSYGALSLERLANLELNSTLSSVSFSEAYATFSNLGGTLRCVLNSAGEAISANALLKLDSYEAKFVDGTCRIPQPSSGHSGDLHIVATAMRRDNSNVVVLNNGELNLGDEVGISATGEMQLAGTAPKSLSFKTISLTLADMSQMEQRFGLNLRNRAPWLTDLNLAGRGTFEGNFAWEANGKAELAGKVSAKDTILQSKLARVKDAGGGAASRWEAEVQNTASGSTKRWVLEPGKDWVQK